MIIEFQYFEGCPNAKETLQNLLTLIDEGIVRKDEIKITKVDDIETAKKILFQGSPSILVNGYDIYSKKKPNSYNFSCRIYKINGKTTGILPKEYIKEAINELRNSIN